MDPVWNVGPAVQRRKDFSAYLQKTKDNDSIKGFLEERQKEVWDGLVRITDDQVTEAENLVKEQRFDEAVAAVTEGESSKTLVRSYAPQNDKEAVPATVQADLDTVTQL